MFEHEKGLWLDFFGLQIIDTYGKDRLGQYRLCQFMSGHLDQKSFWIQNILGGHKILRP